MPKHNTIQMPRYRLEVKADLDYMTNLKPMDNDFRWFMKFRCTACDYENPEWEWVNGEDKIPTPDGKKVHHYKQCRECGAPQIANLIKSCVRPYDIFMNNKFQMIAAFDCEGIEPVEFDPMVGWQATSTLSAAVISDISLDGREWSGQEGAMTLGIYQLNSRFVEED